jgi:hypothetical protein
VEDPTEKGAITLRTLWRGVEDQPLLFANQFVIQTQQDAIILTVGQFQGPILLGNVEDQIAQARQLGHIPITVVARLAFTRERLGELSDALQEHIRKYDSQREG